jgi:hypothetical protein
MTVCRGAELASARAGSTSPSPRGGPFDSLRSLRAGKLLPYTRPGEAGEPYPCS